MSRTHKLILGVLLAVLLVIGTYVFVLSYSSSAAEREATKSMDSLCLANFVSDVVTDSYRATGKYPNAPDLTALIRSRSRDVPCRSVLLLSLSGKVIDSFDREMTYQTLSPSNAVLCATFKELDNQVSQAISIQLEEGRKTLLWPGANCVDTSSGTGG